MPRYISLTPAGDPTPQFYDTHTGAVVTVIDTDPLASYNYALRMGGNNGFSPDRKWRKVASIEMSAVKMLADTKKDADAHAYFYEHDEKARDRMIRRYPELFKACSGDI